MMRSNFTVHLLAAGHLETVRAVVVEALRPEQVVENMAALDVVDKLTPDVLARIEGILDNKPTPLSDFR